MGLGSGGMDFRCPGCGELTPGVRAEEGRPVYCTQCGRGYRFAPGFFHRYLYFALNRPLLTYMLLLPVAVLASTSFPPGLRLFYLVFYTGAYWWLLDRLRRSAAYLEVLPTGPHAGLVRPAAPARRRLSLWAVTLFVLSLVVFPCALLGGILALTPAGELCLDLVRAGPAPENFTAWLAGLELARVRAGAFLVAATVGLAFLVFFLLTLVGLTVVRAREQRGRELLAWALVLWALNGALLGGQALGVVRLLNAWQRREAVVAARAPEAALTLGEGALDGWLWLASWARRGEPREALRLLRLVLEGRLPPPAAPHRWLTRGVAAGLVPRLAERLARRPGPLKERERRELDRTLSALIRASRSDPDPVVRRAARRALRRLPRLHDALPETEAYTASLVRAGTLPRDLTLPLLRLGTGKPLAAAVGALLRDPEVPLAAAGSLARALVRGSPAAAGELVAALLRDARAGSPERRRRALEAALLLGHRAAAPLYLEALRRGGSLRRRTVQVLYRVYAPGEIPPELRRWRYRFPRRFRHDGATRAAELWEAFLARELGDR